MSVCSLDVCILSLTELPIKVFLMLLFTVYSVSSLQTLFRYKHIEGVLPSGRHLLFSGQRGFHMYFQVETGSDGKAFSVSRKAGVQIPSPPENRHM